MLLNKEYNDELKRAMNWLGEQDNTLFLGQAVCYAGTGCYDSLTEVPSNKKMEFPVAENFQIGVSTGQLLNAQLSSVGITADGSVSIPVFENPLSLALGTVDPGPDANVTGQQLTTTLNNNGVIIDIAVVAIPTGQLLSTSLDSVSIGLNTPVNVTGQNLTTAVSSVTVVLNTPVNVTGNNLTGATGQLYVTSWSPVDPGQSINYTGVNTGQSVNWTEVAA